MAKGYIAVEEVEKLLKAWRREVKGLKRAETTDYDRATWSTLMAASNGLARVIVASAKEGVTIDKFEVANTLTKGGDYALLLHDEEADLFKAYEDKSGTLVFIPEGKE